MSALTLETARAALAALAALGVAALAIAAAAARQHFQIALSGFVAMVFASLAAAAAGAPTIAVALGAAAGIVFALNASLTLLTDPAPVRPGRRKIAASLISALFVAAIGWAGQDVASTGVVDAHVAWSSAAAPVALVLLAAAVAAYALLGFGERAVFTRYRGGD